MGESSKIITGFAFMIIFVGVGIFCLVTLGSQSDRCTVEAVGTVIDVYSHGDRNGIHRYATITYQVGDQTITGTVDNSKLDEYRYQRNEQLTILYNPEQVGEFVVQGDYRWLILGGLFITFGLVAGLLSFRRA